MTKTLNTDSENRIAVWAITPNGAALAVRIAAALPGADVFATDRLEGLPESAVRFRSLAEAVAGHFHRCDGHVFIMATGIVVRSVAGLLVHKTADPAVVVVDDRGTFAVSLLSGHLGGANRLAGQVAAAIGAQPVITTATDVNAVPAIDVLAAERGLKIENPQAIKTVNMALLTGSPVEQLAHGDQDLDDDQRDDVPLDAQAPPVVLEGEQGIGGARDQVELPFERVVALRQLVLLGEPLVQAFEVGTLPEGVRLLLDLDPPDHPLLDVQGAADVAQ